MIRTGPAAQSRPLLNKRPKMSDPARPTDRRIRRTREALYSALLSLIVRKGYDATTIADILEEADVGRSTFYLHFSGKDALLHYGITRLAARLDEAVAGHAPGDFAFLPPLIDHVRAHAGLFSALLTGGGSTEVTAALAGIVETHVGRELTALRIDGNHIGGRILAGGLVSALRSLALRPDPAGAQSLLPTVRAMATAIATLPTSPTLHPLARS
jgi:AcrR family transcriptional regulator